MKNTTICAAMSALLLSACDQPVAPRVSQHVPRRTNAAYTSTTGDAIAYSRCDVPWTTMVLQCDLVVLEANGHETLLLQEAIGLPLEWIYHTWSPDGTKIAVNGNTFSVVTVADGSVATAPFYGGYPDWSPDGARIAFVGDGYGPAGLYVTNADFSNLTLVTDSAADGAPTWSPDGTRLVFGCAVDAGNRDLCIINTDGSGFARLTSGPEADINPDFSPDGTQVAFNSNRDGTFRLYLLNIADGSIVQPFGTYLDSTSRPQWSPDGKRIAFSCCSMGGLDPADHYYYHGENMGVVWLDDGTGSGVGSGGSNPVWRPTLPVPADAPPVARFSFSCVYLTCTFDASASTDDWGLDGGYSWTFAPNAVGTIVGPVSTFTYATEGTYQISLTVTDFFGQRSTTTTRAVTVTAAPDAPPVASFTASCSGMNCTFESAASSDDNGIVSRSWTFGDGTSAGNLIAPNHSYGTSGTFAVTLTVADTKGQTNNITHSVTPVDQPPVARFTYSCGGTLRGQTTCTFDGRSSTDDIAIVSYEWKLGGNGTASGGFVSTSFKSHSTQIITLTVTDAAHQSRSTSQTITLP